MLFLPTVVLVAETEQFYVHTVDSLWSLFTLFLHLFLSLMKRRRGGGCRREKEIHPSPLRPIEMEGAL